MFSWCILSQLLCSVIKLKQEVLLDQCCLHLAKWSIFESISGIFGRRDFEQPIVQIRSIVTKMLQHSVRSHWRQVVARTQVQCLFKNNIQQDKNIT